MITYLGYNEYFDFNDFEYLKNNLYITYIDGNIEKKEKLEFNLNYINDKFEVQKENEIALSEEVTQNIISDDLTEKIKKCFDKTDGGYLYVYTQKNVEHRIDYVEEDNDMTSEEKQTQELNSLRNISDSFKKIIIVNGTMKPWRNEEGFVIMGMKYFLLHADSLNF